MPVQEREKQAQPVAPVTRVLMLHATWGLPSRTDHWNGGAPRKRGDGARLAVRKYGASLDKLADS
jgi:hypothetical protein